MKHLIIFFITVFFAGNTFSQIGMPQVTLPDHQQKWRTYFDALDQSIVIFNATTNNKNEVFLLLELLGPTNTTHLTTPNAFQTVTLPSALGNPRTPLIIKFDSLGIKRWGTFFGKSIYGRGITTDDIGNVYLCGFYPGTTPSQSYVPVTPGAFKTQELPFSITVGSQTLNVFAGDGYLAKFSPTGALLWCTLYGGQGGEHLENIAVDKDYNVYVTGSTNSGTDISTPGSFKENFVPGANSGISIGMLVKFDGAGHRQWGTYYGGDNTTNTTPSQIAVDSSGNIIIAGSTNSHIGIATAGSHLGDFSTSGSNQYRLFVAKFDSRGSRLWGTYYGSSQPVNNGVNINLSGLLTKGDNIYFTGSTNMTGEIASAGSFMEQNAGGFDAFVAALNADGTRKWGSYFGGNGADVISYNCIRLAKNKKAFYVMGRTNSTSGISTNNTYNQGEMISNPYILKMDVEGNRIWSSYVSVHTNLNNLSDAALPTDNSISFVTTNEGALYTLIRQPKQGCFPLGTPAVFQDTSGGTNTTFLFTKYSDTTKLFINTPPAPPAVPLSFEVYPNPSNGQFTIRTTSTQPYDYIIYAADGKLIKVNITAGYYTAVNITSTAAGIYIVKATDRSTGQVYHRKILKR